MIVAGEIKQKLFRKFGKVFFDSPFKNQKQLYNFIASDMFDNLYIGEQEINGFAVLNHVSIKIILASNNPPLYTLL